MFAQINNDLDKSIFCQVMISHVVPQIPSKSQSHLILETIEMLEYNFQQFLFELKVRVEFGKEPFQKFTFRHIFFAGNVSLAKKPQAKTPFRQALQTFMKLPFI